MSLFDLVKSRLGAILSDASSSQDGAPAGHEQLATELIDMIKSHGLGGLAERFSAKGLGDLVASWIGHGANLPISAEQVEHVLGSEELQAIAAKLGISPESVKASSAKLIPVLIDHLTPAGKIEHEA